MKLTRDEEIAIKLLRGKGTVQDIIEYKNIVTLKTLDGNNLVLTCSQVVNQLKKEVPQLNTTIFNEWLANVMKLGTYNKIGKKRVFQPNEHYNIGIIKEGLAVTGTSSTNQVKPYYTQSMVNRILSTNLKSLKDYTEARVTGNFNNK